MIRKIIHIDEEKCNGCGLCARACHESAIGIIDGKAKLLREDYCDGLGDCLPACPTNAISFVEKEAAAYDEAAVLENKKKLEAHSQLQQWPVQIKLVPINAPYFDDADLLIAADCTAYAYANFHQDFIKGKITLIGCPKLDSVDYSEKLTEIIRQNNIKSYHRAHGSSMLRRNPECSHKCHESQRKISSMAGVHHLHRWKDSCLILPHKNPDCSTQPGFFIPVIPLIDESYLPLQYQRFLQWNYKIECTPISLFFFSLITPKSSLTHSVRCPDLVSPVRIWRPAWLPRGQ